VTRCVLDASVAAKWFLPASGETLTEEALRLLEGYVKGDPQFLVPDLFWPEFGNILWKAVRLGRISRESVASNAPLVTADERLVNALAARFSVLWLGSL